MGNLKSYITGFVSSILLTLAAYFAVQTYPGSMLIPLILVLAVVQLVVQLICFLHLGSGGERWKLGVFISTVALVLIVVVGSIWIMDHLNYNMTPMQVNEYMQDQQGGF